MYGSSCFEVFCFFGMPETDVVVARYPHPPAIHQRPECCGRSSVTPFCPYCGQQTGAAVKTIEVPQDPPWTWWEGVAAYEHEGTWYFGVAESLTYGDDICDTVDVVPLSEVTWPQEQDLPPRLRELLDTCGLRWDPRPFIVVKGG